MVISELDVLPVDVLQVVLLLFQFEDVTHKELLQVLVRKVDAKLLKTVEKRSRKDHFRSNMLYISLSFSMIEAVLSDLINHSVRLLLDENFLIGSDNQFFFPKSVKDIICV